MSQPEHPIFARIYDPVMQYSEKHFLGEHRDYLTAGLSGTVLDIGTGTGAMLPHFAEVPDDLSIHAIEPDPHMRTQAEEKATQFDLDIEILDAGAEQLPYGDDTFDYAIAALVFCTIPDVDAALAEVARVLKPGGEFRFLEHVKGAGCNGRLHDLVQPAWYHVAAGCHLNRQTGRRFRTDERFELLEYDRYESGANWFQPFVRGRLQRHPEATLPSSLPSTLPSANSLLERVL